MRTGGGHRRATVGIEITPALRRRAARILQHLAKPDEAGRIARPASRWLHGACNGSHSPPALADFWWRRFVTIFDDDATITNASAHIGWALAIPLAGEQLGGRKGLWIAGLSWMTFTLVQETFFHAPPHPSPAYPGEVRGDLLTRLVPTLAL